MLSHGIKRKCLRKRGYSLHWEPVQYIHHTPVLLAEVLKMLSPQRGETVLDGTVGLGGHSAAFLEAVGREGHLIALDADRENLEEARKRLQLLPGRKTFLHRNFRELPELSLPPCNIVFADLGLSSPHIDDPERGFSFRREGPLDLRFNRQSGRTAAEWLAGSSLEQLEWVLREYGEVRLARRLSVEVLQSMPETTADLCSCVERVYGFRAKSVLPQVFQALRIAVNGELAALEVLLRHGPVLLVEGGKMGIVSFHSLEDRVVKRAFRALATPEIDEKTGAVTVPASFQLLAKRALKPGQEEIAANPRARSARLRIIQRVA